MPRAESVLVGLRRRRGRPRCPCGWRATGAYDSSVRRWRHLPVLHILRDQSKNVENAVALLKFLTSDAEAATTMGMARGVPIPQTMRDRIKSSLTGLDKVVFDNYTLIAGKELAPLQPYPPGAGQLFQTSLTTANQSVGFGKASVSQAADQFFADAARVLK